MTPTTAGQRDAHPGWVRLSGWAGTSWSAALSNRIGG